MTATTLPQRPATFIVQLRNDLVAQLLSEIELTLRVAVMHAAGMTRPQITKALAVTDTETKMAMVRLERIAGTW